MFLARVYVTLKPSVNDPQGLAIAGGLRSMGYTSVEGVRAGKYLEVKVDEPDRASAETKVREMCHRLLANVVIEDFRFDLERCETET
ncbi:MAG: phosphoribosylformylglycinamidine synthase subunit PurS [Dehalococcoidia bacterium]|nr:phosphoribosylformylglycinamidine synthase subunit PurS [Dehalococcoidia bacterium]